jgi:hypothetical protein
MDISNLWEARKLLPGISEGEFAPWEIESHNLKFIKPYVEEKIDDKLYTKKRLRERLKELRAECYKLLAESSEDPFAALCNQPRLERINRRIREYVYRLQPVSKRPRSEITQDTIQRAKESPISDHLGTWKFHRRGKTSVGLCPFHKERTGSFTIYTKNNRWTCFAGCGSGDSIDLVMKLKNLSFIQAVKFLCPNTPSHTNKV